MHPNTEIAISTLLLGSEVTKRLYSLPQTHMEGQATTLLGCGFLDRLRLLLKHCCTALGVEATTSRLRLPRAIAQHLVDEFIGTQDDKLRSAEDTEDAENCETEVVLSLSEEQRKSIMNMYTRGVKIQYIAGLFDIENPRVIHSWDDWKKRPKAEADKSVERRMQIASMLGSGQSEKSVRLLLKLKKGAYRELMGIATGPAFSRKVVSQNTGVPLSYIRLWMMGKCIPKKPLLEEDADNSIDVKKKAIIRFYEIGRALAAAKLSGVPKPQTLERWVAKYQAAVDAREKAESIDT